MLASSLDYELTLAGVARLAVPALADYCAVDIVEEDGEIRRLAVAHADPEKEPLARELLRYPPDPTWPEGVPKVLRTGAPVIYRGLNDAVLGAVARDAEHLRILRELGSTSVICVPLLARGRTLGAISFVYGESGRRHTRRDLALAEDLARRAAMAVDNARLYRDAEAARAALDIANQQVLEAEAEKAQFYREVVRCVTRGKFHLVSAVEAPEGRLALESALGSMAEHAAFRQRLREVASGAGMPHEAIEDLVLAVGEAAGNAVRHAAAPRGAVYVLPDRLVARVSDRGAGIRPEHLAASILLPGFSTEVSLGMGYTLMLELADRLWLATGPEGTVVQLEKRIHPEEQPESAVTAFWERV